MGEIFSIIGCLLSAYQVFKDSNKESHNDLRLFIRSWYPLFELLRFFKKTHNLSQSVMDSGVRALFCVDMKEEDPATGDSLIIKWKDNYKGDLQEKIVRLMNKLQSGPVYDAIQKQAPGPNLDVLLRNLTINESIDDFQKNIEPTIKNIREFIKAFQDIDSDFACGKPPDSRWAYKEISTKARTAMQCTDSMMLSIIPIVNFLYEAVNDN